MAEYKDVTAIKEKMQNICDGCWHPHRLGGCPEHCGINDAVKVIDSAPTVDAVSVVRCGDCIRYHPDDDVWGWCTVSGKMRRKDFCSYGVRKDGER